MYKFHDDFPEYFSEHLFNNCRFSYAETWELIDLFAGTKIFSYHICYEN